MKYIITLSICFPNNESYLNFVNEEHIGWYIGTKDVSHGKYMSFLNSIQTQGITFM